MEKPLKTGILLAGIILCVPISAAAQSGRIRPNESPSPTPTPAPAPYNPTEKPAPTRPGQQKAEDQEVIRVESGLVPMPVSVVDRNGSPVTDLKPEDFILEIDGVKVPVGDVSRTVSPVRLVLMFDNSSSVTVARDFEKRASIRFLRTVIRPERDQAAIFSVSTVSRLEHPLTSDVGALISAIEEFPQPVGLTALLDGFIGASDYLKKLSGRRVVVLVSDGEDTGSDAGFDEALRSLLMSNIQVFVVKTTDFENFKRTQSRERSANLKQLAAERRMQEITRQTGGAVYSPLEDEELEAAFRSISREISDQYLVSFFPEDDKDRSVRFRSVRISVRNRPDLSVRTRVGYYGPL